MAASQNEGRVIFTKEMRKTHTILVPNMLHMHFKLLVPIFNTCGYKCELLENDDHSVIEAGLKYVHNDTCYPALLIIGQFISALQSGKYDVNKTALLLTQTGGGCRASNYIPLLRKALKKAGFGHVPVISISFTGIEKNPGFKISVSLLKQVLYGVYFGDLLMSLVNQCRPYEVTPGSTKAMAEKWVERLAEQMSHKKNLKYKVLRNTYIEILQDFDRNLPRTAEKKVKVGIVGEIFVKFSPLGNNDLENFLVGEGAETVMAGLQDFLMYCLDGYDVDDRLYGKYHFTAKIMRVLNRYLHKKQLDFISMYKEYSSFTPPTDFYVTKKAIEGYINEGVQMGEGWLLTAEMVELIHSGVKNVVCTQPFGCLPNHIVGKGMMKFVREHHPGVNLVSVDYDASASRINQENRLKLMLANANLALKQTESTPESLPAEQPTY
ncbi:MAG: 2-hydroxyacyl-CoA dehydratase [Clostridia bacterium]|nr:2-hydroxyacyl-CoA dehydratase [Clostridia bacterium]